MCALVVFLTLSVSAVAQGISAQAPRDLTDFSIEELLQVEVTLVSRTPERLDRSPAAVFVITPEDIRRTGVNTVADALRMVPGLQVSSIDGNMWAVTARGFNDLLANKLLVLVDGRSVYSPVFSGVFWDMLNVPMEDIERIEVVRGPGATLWGSNAVNGIINVVTKSATDTQGTYVKAGGGTEHKYAASGRIGRQIGENAFARVYALALAENRGGDMSPTLPAHDASNAFQTGFRADWRLTDRDELTLHGDVLANEGEGSYRMLTTPNDTLPQRIDGTSDNVAANIVGRWQREFSSTSDMSLQMYYDYSHRTDPGFDFQVHTLDVDFQHRFALGSRNEFTWGLNNRFIRDDFVNAFPSHFIPAQRSSLLFSAFLQDQYTAVPDRVFITAGSKFERTTDSGWQIQPSLRTLAVLHPRHTVWASVARAMRTPCRGDLTLEFEQSRIYGTGFGGAPIIATLVGNPDYKPEKLTAWEAGYRVQPTDNFSIDATAFYNQYDDLRSLETDSSGLTLRTEPSNFVLVPIKLENYMYGTTWGAEVAGSWRATPWWHFDLAYTYFSIDLTAEPISDDFDWQEGYAPDNQLSVRSSMDLPGNLQFDLWFRWVDTLPRKSVDPYSLLDIRLGWWPTPKMELSVLAHDLLAGEHTEFILPTPNLVDQTVVQPGVFAAVAFYFE